jgi:S-layer homology domain
MRALAAVALCCAVLPASSLAAGGTSHSWAQPRIKLVTTRKLFAGTPATFRPQDPLTEGTLARVIGRLTNTPAKKQGAPGKGPKSKPAQVDHTGIYLGNGWFINSSGYGVALPTLDGGAASRFAWARRPLAEAGLL